MNKPIEGFENYLIYDDGRVWSIKRSRFLKQETKKDGYLRVGLYKNDKIYHKYIHRLVAEAFISNPNNLPEVNHKDENKENNNVDNLEWMTSLDNTNYGTCIQRRTEKLINNIGKSKMVLQYDKNMNKIDAFPSIKEAERQTGLANTNIGLACRETHRTCGGYYWRYANG